MTEHTYRPRISRERRDKIIAAGTRLNGGEVSFHEALGLLVRYLDVLHGDVTCPQCGASDVEDRSHGRFFCWRCQEDRDSGHFSAWDVLDVADTDEATLPGTREDIRYRFVAKKSDEDSGTSDGQKVQHGDSRQAGTTKSTTELWDEGF